MYMYITLSFQGIVPHRKLNEEAMDEPIDHYNSDDDAARACGIAYKDALISGKFWSDDGLVKDWFGDLEDPQNLDFDN